MLTKLRRSFRRKRHSYSINSSHDGSGCYHESLNNSRGVSPASHESSNSDVCTVDPYQDYLLYDQIHFSKTGSLPNEYSVRI